MYDRSGLFFFFTLVSIDVVIRDVLPRRYISVVSTTKHYIIGCKISFLIVSLFLLAVANEHSTRPS